VRRISYGLTQDAFEDGTKDVTRRLGWLFLKAGDHLRAVDRVMGFKPGQKARELGIVEVISVRRERLDAITPDEVRREGFTARSHTPKWFVDFFCSHMRCTPATVVTRIEFRRIG
jgi:hypothetical protein